MRLYSTCGDGNGPNGWITSSILSGVAVSGASRKNKQTQLTCHERSEGARRRKRLKEWCNTRLIIMLRALHPRENPVDGLLP